MKILQFTMVLRGKRVVVWMRGWVRVVVVTNERAEHLWARLVPINKARRIWIDKGTLEFVILYGSQKWFKKTEHAPVRYCRLSIFKKELLHINKIRIFPFLLVSLIKFKPTKFQNYFSLYQYHLKLYKYQLYLYEHLSSPRHVHTV
jgi:hypothetical protein